MKKLTILAAAVPLAVTTACGASVAPSGGTGATPIAREVMRCGEKVTYHDPKRVVAYEAGSADKLFALGLGDRMLGYVMTPTNPDPATSPYAADYAKLPLLSSDLLNKEVVVEKKADMVVAGWNSGFSEKRGITPAILDGLGIASFMHTETCFNYPGFPEKQAPMAALFTDLERLGQIFGVEDRSRAKVDELRGRLERVKASVPADAHRPRVFFYDSGTDAPSTIGNQVPAHEIIQAAGGQHIFGGEAQRYMKGSWESVVQADPEVIMIMSYRDKPAAEKIAFLKQHPALSQVPAVKADRFYVIDYNECISGPRTIDGAEKFAAWLRDHR